MDISGNDFNQNYVSVFVPPSLGLIPNNISLSLFDVHFTCSGSLPVSFAGQTISIGNNSFAGMMLNDMAGVIGNTGANAGTVTFSELNNGIIGINSSLLVQNSTFKSIKTYDPGTYTMPMNGSLGTAIFSGADFNKSGSLYQRGIGMHTPFVNPGLTFDDCFVGIYANNIGADIADNSMDGVGVGIVVQNTQYKPVEINYNDIHAILWGLLLNNVAIAQHINVSQNVIGSATSSVSFYQQGLRVNEFGFNNMGATKYYYNLACNSVEGDFQTGMLLSRLPSFSSVTNNTISTTSTGMTRGIDFQGCNLHPVVNSNAVEGNDPLLDRAYVFSLSNDADILNNHSAYTFYGFDFQGPNTNTRFITNDIGQHFTGLHLDGAGVIGIQYDPGTSPTTVNNNQWLSDPSPNGSVYGSMFGALNENCGANQSVLSQFRVPNTSVLGETDFPYNDCIGNGTWFTIEIGPTIIDPSYTSECIVYHNNDDVQITELDRMIAWDSIATEIFEPESKFILASDLFDKLERNPGLKEGDSLLTAFYDNKENTALGKLSRVRIDIQFVFDEDTNVINEIALNDSLIITMLLRKSVIDTLLQNGISANDSLTFLDESTEIIGQVNNFLRTQNELISLLHDERQNKIDSAINRNNSIVAIEDIEINEKIVNAIYLDKIVYNNYDLDSAQKANLDYVALQCPFAGGRAVYSARVVKSLLGDSTVYNDSLACVGLGYRHSDTGHTSNNLFIKVSPNPLSESCLFNYQLPKDISGRIEIYDIVGNKIDAIDLDANSANKIYYTTGLVSGLYQFRLISENKVMGFGKMAVIK